MYSIQMDVVIPGGSMAGSNVSMLVVPFNGSTNTSSMDRDAASMWYDIQTRSRQVCTVARPGEARHGQGPS
jgi:hypothetical protein